MPKPPEDKSLKLKISDHAVVRYLERVMGLDIEKIKAEMIPEKMDEKILKRMYGGQFKWKIKGCHTLVIKDRTIITVTPN